MVPSKDQQIESLLDGTACELVEHCVPADRISADSYSEVFTVNRSEILTYLRTNRRLEDVVHTSSGPSDGFYALLRDGDYLTFIQERKIRMQEATVETKDDVWEHVVDYLIGHSGTGLKFK